MKRILFVDDEPNILDGLKRMLRPMRREWEMDFAGNAQEALEIMEHKAFDVIVSDMRMPGMDGATLLTEVMKRHPHTIRFVLSGQSDRETIFRSVGPTHQFMAKPCDADMLKSRIDRAFALRALLSDDSLQHLISQIPSLPPMPQLYARLLSELQSPDCSVSTVGRIIESDVGMTAKVLQWVNSAFFGIRQHVTSPTQATSLIGLDTIRALVLMVGAFSSAAQSRVASGFSFDQFCDHSMAVGAFARVIAKCEGLSENDLGDYFTGAVLHDTGRLILAVNRREQYERVLGCVAGGSDTLASTEMQFFGCTHAEVGAYLLGLWGLPDPVVEAVAFHHKPADCPATGFCPLIAVHVADYLAHDMVGDPHEGMRHQLDLECLRSLGLDGRFSAWTEACASMKALGVGRQ